MKRVMVCVSNRGMEEHLTVGEQYALIGMDGNLGVFEKGNQGSAIHAFVTRFADVPKSFPRYKKPRKVKQKPPVRVKSDVVVTYKNGKSYTIKDIKAIYAQAGVFKVSRIATTKPGVQVEESYNMSDVVSAYVKTPKESIQIDIINTKITVTSRHHSFFGEYYFWEA